MMVKQRVGRWVFAHLPITRSMFDQLRFEANAWHVAAQNLVLPDLEGFRELAVPDPFSADLPTRMDVINHLFHQWGEHRWAYDFETLTLRLRTAWFDGIEQTGYRRSILPALAQDRDVHAPYSLQVDAVKP